MKYLILLPLLWLLGCTTNNIKILDADDLTDPATNPCMLGNAGDYSQLGPYGYKAGIKSGIYYTVIPQDMPNNGCLHPVIAFSMGTFAAGTDYTNYYNIFASYGFVVVVDTQANGQWTGVSLINALKWIYGTEYAPLLTEQAGLMGHSQGGGAAYAARMEPHVSAVVGLEPAMFSITKNPKAYLGMGGTLDQFGLATDPIFAYNLSTGPKFYAYLNGADHVIAPVFDGPKQVAFKAAATAWFRCYLSSDDNACKVFSVGNCSKMIGSWSRCKGDKLSN